MPLSIASLRTTENGGICGYDGSKKVTHKWVPRHKRHLVNDTLRLALRLIVHVPDAPDLNSATSFGAAEEPTIVKRARSLK